MKLLLIDYDIEGKDVLINARQSDVDYIIINETLTSYDSLFNDIINLNKKYEEIALVQHGKMSYIFNFFNNTELFSLNDYTTFYEFKEWLCKLRDEVGLSRFDLLGCALYNNDLIRNIIAKLEEDTKIDLRASSNFTGNPENGGDWIMESDNVDIRETYFTDAISNFKDVLLVLSNFNLQKYIRDIYGNRIYSQTDICGRPLNAAYDTSGYLLKYPKSAVLTWGAESTGGCIALTPSIYSKLLSDVIAICSNNIAFAALKSDGSVVTWGDNSAGGDSSGVAIYLSSGVKSIYPTNSAFAALKNDGSVVTWGNSFFGGNSSSVRLKLLSNVVMIYSNLYAFAALKSDGSVVTWGNSLYGGSSIDVSNQLLSNVVTIYSNNTAFAALKSDGSVVCWGDSTSGGSMSTMAPYLQSNVVSIYSTSVSFAALKSDGSVVCWGNSLSGGGTIITNKNIVNIWGNASAFAAITNLGKVITWGSASGGGDISVVANDLSSGIVTIYATYSAFAALSKTGKVITWGSASYGADSSSVAASLQSNVVSIYPNLYVFVALKSDGQIIAWGNTSYGGNLALTSTSSAYSHNPDMPYISIMSSSYAFSALRSTGQLYIWGNFNNGAYINTSTNDAKLEYTKLNFNNFIIYSTASSFAALRPTSYNYSLLDYYYLTGASKSLDSFPLLPTMSTPYIIKSNNFGLTLNPKLDYNSFSKRIAIGKDGIYACGDYTGNLSSLFPGLTNVGTKYAGFLIKFDFNGNVIWAKPLFNSSMTFSMVLAIEILEDSTSDKNGIFISGTYTGTLTPYLVSKTDAGYIIKFKTDGTYQWSLSFDGGTTVRESCPTLCLDENGIYVGLITNASTITIFNATGITVGTISGFYTNITCYSIAVIQLTHQGGLMSGVAPIKIIPSAPISGVLNSIKSIRSIAVYNNNLYFSIWVNGIFTAPTYPFTLDTSANVNTVLLKYTTSGTFVNSFSMFATGSTGSSINCIRVDSTGIYMSGKYDRQVTIPSALSNILFTEKTSVEGFLIKLIDSTLQVDWVKSFQQLSSDEYATSISLTNNSIYFCIGYYNLNYNNNISQLNEYYRKGTSILQKRVSLSADGTIASSTISSALGIIKYDVNGNYIYSQKIYDASGVDFPASVDSKYGIIGQSVITNWTAIAGSGSTNYIVNLLRENIISIVTHPSIANSVLISVQNMNLTYSIYKNGDLTPLITQTDPSITTFVDSTDGSLTQYTAILSDGTVGIDYYGSLFLYGSINPNVVGRIDLSHNLLSSQRYNVYRNDVLIAPSVIGVSYIDLSSAVGDNSYYISVTINSSPLFKSNLLGFNTLITFNGFKTSNLGEIKFNNINSYGWNFNINRNYTTSLAQNINGSEFTDISAIKGDNLYIFSATSSSGITYSSLPLTITLTDVPSFTLTKGTIQSTVLFNNINTFNRPYNVYRNNTLIANNVTTSTYTDLTPTAGINTYYITAISAGGVEFPSLSASINVLFSSIFPPQLTIQNESYDSIKAIPSGGNAPYSYQWFKDNVIITNATSDSLAIQNSFVTADIPLLSIYTNRVTDASNNIVDASAVITFAPYTSLTATAVQENVIVAVDSSANLQLNVTNGKGPYTYSWTLDGCGNILSTQEFLTLSNNYLTADISTNSIYRCAVKDSLNLKTVNVSFNVTFAPYTSLTATAVQENIIVALDSSANLQLNVTNGKGPYTYSWTLDGCGNVISTQEFLTLSNNYLTADISTNSIYRCAVKDSLNLKTVNVSFNVTFAPYTSLTATAVQENVIIQYGNFARLSLNVTNGKSPYNYAWNVDGCGNVLSMDDFLIVTNNYKTIKSDIIIIYHCAVKDSLNLKTIDVNFTITFVKPLSLTIQLSSPDNQTIPYANGSAVIGVTVLNSIPPITYTLYNNQNQLVDTITTNNAFYNYTLINNYLYYNTNALNVYTIRAADDGERQIDISTNIIFQAYPGISFSTSNLNIELDYKNISTVLSIFTAYGGKSNEYTYNWKEVFDNSEQQLNVTTSNLTLTNNYLYEVYDVMRNFKCEIMDISFNKESVIFSVLYKGFPSLAATATNQSITINYNNDKKILLVDNIVGGKFPFTYFWYEISGNVEIPLLSVSPRFELINNYNYSGNDVIKNYKFTVKDSRGASSSVIFTATFKAYPAVSASTNTSSYTLNYNNQSAKLSVDNVFGGKEPYLYNWYEISGTTNIQLLPIINELTVTNSYATPIDITKQYKCVVQDVFSTSDVIFSVLYKGYPGIIITRDATSITIPIELSGNLEVQSISGGIEPYKYIWYEVVDNNIISIGNQGKTNLMLHNTFKYYGNSVNQIYRFEVTDAQLNKSFVDFNVVYEAYNFIAYQNANKIDVYANQIARLGIDNILGGTKPYTFEWYTVSGENNVTLIPDASSDSIFISNYDFFKGEDRTTLYKGIIKDATNQSYEFFYGVSLKPHIQLRIETNNISTVNFNEEVVLKAIVVYGTPPYIFQWYRNNIAIYNSSTYTITSTNDAANNIYESTLKFINKELNSSEITDTFKCSITPLI